MAETQAQATINPLIDDYGFASTRAKAAVELLTAAQKSGIAAGNELKDVQQLLSGNFENLSPLAQQQAQAMLQLATEYAAAEAASNQLKDAQDNLAQSMEDAKQLGKDVLGGFIKDLQGGASASEALSNALAKVADRLLDIGLNQLFGIGGNSNGGNLFSSLFGGIGKLLGFDGGGYTGNGPRSGGLDGKGGYLAMVHPQETIIDHTKGVSVPRSALRPSVGGAGSTAVEVVLRAQTDSSVIMEIADSQIKSRAPAIVRTSVQQSQAQTKNNMPGFLANAQTRAL